MNLPFVGPRKTARGNGGVLGRVARSTFEAPALWALAEYKVMPHYLAFLCGINLGKRRIKMAHLAAFTPREFHGLAWQACYALACEQATGRYPLPTRRGYRALDLEVREALR